MLHETKQIPPKHDFNKEQVKIKNQTANQNNCRRTCQNFKTVNTSENSLDLFSG